MGILNKDELEVNACNDQLLNDPYSCSQYLNKTAMTEHIW